MDILYNSLSAIYQNIFFYSFSDKKSSLYYSNHNFQTDKIIVSNDKKILAISQFDNSVKLFETSDYTTSKLINQIWNSPFINYKTSFLLSDNIISLDFSPSNDLLLLLTKDNNINFLNTTYEKNNFSDLVIYIEPFKNFFEILQKMPGYSVDIFLKRLPRLVNEPYTKEMGFKIVKKVTERGVVRLVKIAAGANI